MAFAETLAGFDPAPEPIRTATACPASDYDVVRRVIEYVSNNWREQPSLERIAEVAGMDPFRLQKLFTRWAGLSPKAFLQALTLKHARALLQDSATVLDAAYEVGLSGPARLHDLFVTHEALTPGAYRARGAGLIIRWGFHESPFGLALVMATERGLAGLAFADPGEEDKVFADMSARWPQADYVEDVPGTAALSRRIFDPAEWRPDRPLRVVMIGTDFEVRVWQTLLAVPLGRLTTYGDIAGRIANPKAARAVGAAIGRNPISFVVPCHRIIGGTGSLTGYHWGLTRKRAIIGWESGIAGQAS
ncbi:methylated-DNA--[protein]-cysteine S-methyltransferase [Propylenella binzhouense]|uniref:methylated-DNA--[protein]-cysteine S-methyltransferase n=1 Tax=Propylenella binzhouense TaxID=2555902 RepID=A0A964WSZ9_9HYPH|nr:bifunctional helix-turn-helix domain-containing protein/methylated-DNA--[protein]-cysteine S-methyltransferase [Propylenella binzhouense]MYZ47421.1 methylated-DNA--[protein]-cysteine S-methyltransferase [Propylenella binzhouense]